MKPSSTHYLLDTSISILLLLFFGCSSIVRGQTNTWSLFHDGGGNPAGFYGQLGVNSSYNAPPARHAPATAVDTQRNILYLFGGSRVSVLNTPGSAIFGDLWRFDVASGIWTWISGSSNLDGDGVYGTKGVFTADAVPSSRYGSSMFYDETSQSLYLFGGLGPGRFMLNAKMTLRVFDRPQSSERSVALRSSHASMALVGRFAINHLVS